MRVLMLVAHPIDTSYTHAVARAARDGLQSAGHVVDCIDLYADGYRAPMSPDERRAYHGEQPVLDPQVADHIERLRAADALVFVYPTWWSSLPAILKGWLERTMVPGVGFTFNQSGKVRPGLTNIHRIVGISTYGSKRAYIRLINDNGRRTLTRALRISAGFSTRCTWLGLYGIDSLTDDDRRRFLDRVRHTMADLR